MQQADFVTLEMMYKFTAFLVFFFFLAIPINSANAQSSKANVLPTRLFGITVDNVDDEAVVLEQLKLLRDANPNNPLPVVRIVFDVDPNSQNTEYIDPKYFEIIKKIREQNLAFVMVQLLDSDDAHYCFKGDIDQKQSNLCFQKRTEAILNFADIENRKLIDYVNIVEIGNEINGPWYGGHEEESAAIRKIARETVISQLKIGYEIVEKLKRTNTRNSIKTSLTFYFNDDGKRHNWMEKGEEDYKPDNAEYSMRKWVRENGKNFPNLDYSFVSYYSDDNWHTNPATKRREPIIPSAKDWAVMFKEMRANYSRAAVGFSEVGPQCHYKKIRGGKFIPTEFEDESSCEDRTCKPCQDDQPKSITDHYLRLDKEVLNLVGNNFVGGYFYWNYNIDVINKIIYANALNNPKNTRLLRFNEAEATRNSLIDAFRKWSK